MCRHAHGHPRSLVPSNTVGDVERTRPRVDDFAYVLVLLGRQSDHEIELHSAPATREDAFRRLHELRLGDIFVHDVTHALASRLRRKGEPPRTLLLHVVEDVFAESVGAQRRHAERDLVRGQRFDGLADQGGDCAVVCRGQRGERCFVVPGFFDGADHGIDDRLWLPFAHRSIDHARLAEATAFCAASRDLDGCPIEDGFAARDRAVHWEWVLVEVPDDCAPNREGCLGVHWFDDVHLGVVCRNVFVERRHVESAELRDSEEAFGARERVALHLGPCPHELRKLRLAVADEKDVDERRHRFCVCRGGATGYDQRVTLGSIGTPERNLPEVEDLQDVGIGQLVLK